jgi:enoyl-CoA hydratase
VIAAIEGYALAGGLEIALACDLIVAARNAFLGIPEVRRGLAAGGGALLRLPRLLPGNLAMEMALTGAAIPVDRLHAVGLVNTVTEPGDALAAALEFARTIAINGPLGVIASKAVIAQSRDWSRDEEWTRQERILAPVSSSEDAREGARAFAEKRAPVFLGR